MNIKVILLIILSFLAGYYLIPSNSEHSFKKEVVTKPASRTTVEEKVISVYKNANPSVVFISTVTLTIDPLDWFPEVHQQKGSGSGVIISAEDGIIITNLHVIQNAHEISIILNEGDSYSAKLLGFDQQYDLAVLKLDNPPSNLQTVNFGNSSTLEVGQRVLAIGNPFGLNKTLTTGIISSLDRSVKSADGILLKGLIQTDAAINPGNSGGPLLDTDGNLVGINTAILSQSGDSAGIGFAIPINKINKILPELIATGKVLRVDLGWVLVDTNQGPMVRRIMEGSAAEFAGIQPFEKIGRRGGRRILQRNFKNADLIMKVNGIKVKSKEEVEDLILEIDPKKELVLELKKGGRFSSKREIKIKPSLK